MFQTVVGETRPVSIDIDPDVARLFQETQEAIELRSALIWGEHCTECVMPTCYSTCALYTPRSDLRCRRFDQGIQPVRLEGRAGIAGMRISFRKWGKLEAAARPATVSPSRMAVLRIVDNAATTLLEAAPLPHRIRDGASIAWNRAKARLAVSGADASGFTAFLIECLSQTLRDCVFTLTVKPAESTRRYFQRHFTLKPGYNRIEVPIGDITQEVNLNDRLLVQVEPVEPPADNAFIFGALEFVAFRNARELSAAAQPPRSSGSPETAKPAAKVKCVVWDLDNTLWRGTLVEDGVESLVVNEAAAEAIKQLDQRGILHSIASKNNAEDALAALERFGLREYFLAPQISWGPKSAGIAEIARRLNIHKNTFLFIDDQPFERAEVLSVHPDVRIAPETRIGELLLLPELDAPITEEARNRRAMYQIEETRESAYQGSSASFIDFLRSCAIKLTVSDLTHANINRVFELSQRTNQLNYAGKACSRKDVEDLLAGVAPGKAGVVLSCSDKFGDYGVVGFAIVDADRFHVENFFMSCRVQHKRVDHAFFAWLLGHAGMHGRSKLTTVFHFSGRNQSARQVLEEMAFSPSAEDSEVYVSPPLDRVPDADVVKVIDRTSGFLERPAHAAI